MPGSATTYLEQAVLAHTLGYGTLPAIPVAYLGLTTTPPTASVGGTEVAGGGYARMSTGTWALVTSLAPSSVAANLATIEFPAATADWGTIGWFELWDAAGGGNRLYWGPLLDPTDGVTPITRAVGSGDIVRFQAGVVQVQAI